MSNMSNMSILSNELLKSISTDTIITIICDEDEDEHFKSFFRFKKRTVKHFYMQKNS